MYRKCVILISLFNTTHINLSTVVYVHIHKVKLTGNSYLLTLSIILVTDLT